MLISPTLQITAPARIHITLIDLGASGYRKNGGIGFAISDRDVTLRFRQSSFNNFEKLKEIGFSETEVDKLCAKIDHFQKTRSLRPIELIECNAATLHSGFGVGTAVCLASIEAIFALSEVNISALEIAQLSGRGGTSGIGICTYFEGGFVFDIGRRRDGSKFASSDDHIGGHALPKIFSRISMPDWRIGLLIPNEATPMYIERKLFSSALPIDQAGVHETTYHSVFGVAAAVSDSDYDAFCSAVSALQETAWKKAEIDAQGRSQRRVMSMLQELGCQGVGMSSVGPAIYFMVEREFQVIELVSQKFPEYQVVLSGCQNHGRTLSYV